ncbi:MAG: RNA polymerase sigma factor, partial [Muribaculaceae bacterium]|nr:RNA polymerase sigma factor [Muribaculaceae bacterium]
YDIELYSINIPQESGLVLQDENCTLKEINQTLSSFANTYSTPLDMFLTGYKYEEIALFMNLPIGTIKSRIFYARKRLQILLKDYREDY